MTDCCLCAQIAGNSARDLLHEVLGAATYERRARDVTAGFVAIPSVGALSPCHVLLCPRRHVRSFAALPKRERDEAQEASTRLEGFLGERWRLPMHLFEHGNARTGDRVSCSVEHAHLHFVGSAASVWGEVANEFAWLEIAGGDLRAAVGDDEYLRYRGPSGKWQITVTDGAPIPSQLMRRVFAGAHGATEAWDWRSDPAIPRIKAMWQELAS
jgi:diadenosine tetraphosphate (Ap4A) HIT family hydrolase